MTARAHISVKTKVDRAIFQARDGTIYCPLCRKYMDRHEPRVFEHLVPRALRIKLGLDPDAPDSLAWVHAECAALKTRGCEGTSDKGSVADGDLHKIAKAERLHDGPKKPKKPFVKRLDPWSRSYKAKLEAGR